MPRGTPFACLLLTASIACGPEANGGIDSGLPPNKHGQDLTPAERDAFCDATIARLDEALGDGRKEANCRVDAVVTATFFVSDVDVAECEESYQECLAEPEEVETECTIPLVWETCDATVADLEACYTHYMDATAELYRTATCDKIAEYREHWPGEDYVPNAACKRAAMVCPDVLPLDVDDEQG